MCHSQGEAHGDTGKFVISHPRAIYLFNAFVDEALGKPTGDNALCSHLLASLLIYSHREVLEQPQSAAVPQSTFANNQMEDYIKTHLRQSLTIEKMAQAMYMSPAQFTRMMRRQTGKSFVEVLTEYRIEEAKRLLRETEWSIAAIARHIGLKSSTYFIKLFGDKTGCSPNNYRKIKID
jgi:AraC-like DNA-binding protein